MPEDFSIIHGILELYQQKTPLTWQADIKTKNYRLYSISLPAFTHSLCTVSAVHEKLLPTGRSIEFAVFKARVKLRAFFYW